MIKLKLKYIICLFLIMLSFLLNTPKPNVIVSDVSAQDAMNEIVSSVTSMAESNSTMNDDNTVISDDNSTVEEAEVIEVPKIEVDKLENAHLHREYPRELKEKVEKEVKVSDGNIIFIGDSRIVGMCNAVYGTTFGNNLVEYTRGNETYIAKVGAGFSYFDAFIDLAKKYVTDNTNIIIALGINDYVSGQEYAEAINNIDIGNVYFMSINPIDDALASKYDYNVSTSFIETKNEEIKNNLEDVEYLDCYSEIKDSFLTSDGIHYLNSTYEEIYELVMSNFKESEKETVEEVKEEPVEKEKEKAPEKTEEINETEESIEKPKNPIAKTGSINKKSVFGHIDANKASKNIATYFRGDTVEIIEEVGDFYKVKLEKYNYTECYISKEHIDVE